MDTINFLSKQKETNLSTLLCLSAILLVLIQSIIYINHLEVNLDEGAYLLKGLYFFQSKYVPYQQYGFWMDQMPLAYLIPGWIQHNFEVGLLTGRLFMIILLCLSMVGLWIVTNRIGGTWSTVFVLWAIALNPILIKMYSTAVTQGITAFLLIWTLVFSLGKERLLWHLLVASFLVTALVLVRINLFPLLLLFLLYIPIKYGWRYGLIIFLVISIILIYVHILYWPGILQIYSRWIPRTISPFLDDWRIDQKLLYWNPEYDFQSRIMSLSRAIRYHSVLIIGSIMPLFGTRKFLISRSIPRNDKIDYLFCFTSYWSILILHSIVTLGGNHCNFCLESYFSFFVPLGYIMIITYHCLHSKETSQGLIIHVILSSLLISGLVGIANNDNFKKGILHIGFPTYKSEFPYFQLSKNFLFSQIIERFPDLEPSYIRLIDRGLTGIFAGILIIAALMIIYRSISIVNNIYTFKVKKLVPSISFGVPRFSNFFIKSLLLLSLLLSPSKILSGGKYVYDCGPQTLKAYINTGKLLASLIPEGSKVYWWSRTPAPLLYVPNIEIYPPQINDIYTFVSEGEDDVLLKLGYWDRSISDKWIKTSDVIIIEKIYFTNNFLPRNILDQFTLITLPQQNLCNDDSQLYVYIKKQK